MITYNVVMRRWAHGWEFHIEGVGVTQAEGSLDDADTMVRDYIERERAAEGLTQPFQIAWYAEVERG